MMAGKKSKSEIEAIRGELTELTEAIYGLREQVRVELAATAAANGSESATADAANAPLVVLAGDPLDEGEIQLRGAVRLRGADADQGDVMVEWSTAGLNANRLADQATDDLARVLAALGHRQRLAILIRLLGGPASAAELVGSLQLGTTGAAYHHLNVLLGAGLVTQAERGVYILAPERVAMLMTVLASPLAHASLTGSGETAEEAEPEKKGRRSRKFAA